MAYTCRSAENSASRHTDGHAGAQTNMHADGRTRRCMDGETQAHRRTRRRTDRHTGARLQMQASDDVRTLNMHACSVWVENSSRLILRAVYRIFAKWGLTWSMSKRGGARLFVPAGQPQGGRCRRGMCPLPPHKIFTFLRSIYMSCDML